MEFTAFACEINICTGMNGRFETTEIVSHGRSGLKNVLTDTAHANIMHR